MLIVKDGNTINFDELAKLHPNIANILRDHQDKNWEFSLTEGRLKLLHSEYKPIFIDIENKLNDHKRYFYKNSPFKENLAKALGHKGMNEAPRVLDASGGLLSDSLLMYAMGISQLTVMERHPLAQILIQNALDMTKTSIEFLPMDASDIKGKYDVIYFDPMYEDINKKSSANKFMSLFREEVGTDKDAVSVAKHLRSFCLKRFVIKRPIKSVALLPNVSMEFRGKSTRYDVYMSL